MSDLSELTALSPGVGSYFIGQNQQSNLDTEAMRRSELAQLIQQQQQTYDQNSKLNPLLIEAQMLKNQGDQASLPGKVAQSEITQQTAKKGAATLDSDILAQQTKNQDEVNISKYNNMLRARDTMLQAGPMLQSVPEPLRAQAFMQHLKQNGINTDSPDIQQMIAAAQRDPTNFPTMVSQIADNLGKQAILLNPQARVQQEGHRLSAAATVQAANIHAGATEEAARITAGGRVDAARVRTEQANNLLQNMIMGKVNPDKAPAAAMAEAQRLDANGDTEGAQYWRDQVPILERYAYNLRNASKEGQTQVETGEDGKAKLTPKTINPVLGESTAKPPKAPTQGTTSSGVKYKIIPNN